MARHPMVTQLVRGVMSIGSQRIHGDQTGESKVSLGFVWILRGRGWERWALVRLISILSILLWRVRERSRDRRERTKEIRVIII